MTAARLRLLLVLAALVSTSCSETGPIYPTSDTLDAWVKAVTSVDPSSDLSPVVTDQVVTFRLARGHRRSALRAGREWGLAQAYLLGFDIRIDPKALGRETVALSQLLRLGNPDAELVSVLLDARRGVTVMGRTCIAPSDLAAWHKVEIRISFADDDTGFLEIFCDRRPLWARDHFRTTLPPTCRLGQGCRTRVPGPVRFEWQVGLVSSRAVAREISVQMQRIFYHRLFVIPNRVGTL